MLECTYAHKTHTHTKTYNTVRSAEMIETPGVVGLESQKIFIWDFQDMKGQKI